MRFRVRKRLGHWEVLTMARGAVAWEPVRSFPTWWEAMQHVTGELPYRDETPWTPGLRPLWV